ncbi:MAG: rod shape-determining protein RodA [Bacteroidales bacterium]|nr:rod shape-determining protein RodA [Bacteroidales bacterium]
MNYPYDTERSFKNTIDWWLLGCYIVLVVFGWLNIYASVHGDEEASIFDFATRSGKQFVWILSSLGIAGIILFIIPPRVYEVISPLLYSIVVFLLIAVIFVGTDIKGSHSWFQFGPVSFQPAEISKITTSLMLATMMSHNGFKMQGRNFWITVAIILLPMLIIIAEKETGSALVYVGFIFMLYREGLSGWLLSIVGLVIVVFILTIVYSPFIGILIALVLISLFDAAQSKSLLIWALVAIPLIILNFLVSERYQLTAISVEAVLYILYSAFMAARGLHQKFRWATISVLAGMTLLVFSADFVFNDILKDYQRARIEVLLGMREDMSGVGYNVNQSKIAIGSGGLLGKGFCQGTQTAYGFVPEQSTDFIFCTVGEEWGFVGCVALIIVYLTLIFRIVLDSEHSRNAFTRIYGYCFASCIFMHLFINIGMTLGLMPVIGIPLPFMSYGGSSMWSFTTMLFIFIALDKDERKYF